MSREALTDYLTTMIWGGLASVLGTANQPEEMERPLRLVSGLDGLAPGPADNP
jgi:hypothetical protein